MIIVDWNFNRLCNFGCAYCVNDPSDKAFIGPTFEQVKPAIDKLTKDYFFAFTGGELLLNPDFIKIAKHITQRFNIGIYSNLSLPMDDFIKEIDPARVKWIVGSLHVTERDRLGISRGHIVNEYAKLKNAGFDKVYIIQVCDSYALSEYDKFFMWYKERGILVIPNRLKSSAWFKQEYTPEEEAKMLYYVNETKCTLFPFEMSEYLDRSGQKCFAGNRYMVITANGMIRKCWSDHTKWYGNFYQSQLWNENSLSELPTICKMKACSCFPSNLHYAEIMGTTCK
jgi:MoaA/NifB/PqqE/SkfB family radical SAM enzyme